MVWHATIRLAFVGETHHDIFYATLVIIMFCKKLKTRQKTSFILENDIQETKLADYLVEIEI